MNIIWGMMIVLGIIYASLTGNIKEVTDGIVESSKEAVTLCIAMLGIMAFWSGIMEIAKESGIINSLTDKMRGILKFFFPNIKEESKANEYIATNFITNMCGLSWAATASGLKAMQELKKLEEERINNEHRTKQYNSNEDTCIDDNKNNYKSIANKNKDMDINDNKYNDKKRTKNKIDDKVKTIKQEIDYATDEMCTFLVLNISSLQLIPINIIAYRSQYGSPNPFGIIVPSLIATGITTLVAAVFCKLKTRDKHNYNTKN